MSRKAEQPMTRAHIWLLDEDIARLHKYFDRNIGFSRAVRVIINNYLNNIEAKALEMTGSSVAITEDVLSGLELPEE